MNETVRRLIRHGFTSSEAAVLNELYPAATRNLSGRVTGTNWGSDDDPYRPHPYYHFHGFAGGQIAGDGKFFDLAGNNHAVRGANLSDAQLFANAGYVSTVDPASGFTDSVLRLPAINFDYNAGETLIGWWLGKATAEASQQHVIGDGYSTTVRGWGVTSTSAGKLQIIISGASQGYSGSSTAAIFDGTLHDFGFVFSGQTRKYAIWTDSALDAGFSDYLTFNSGADFDTKTTNTVNIGAASPAPGGTSGIAVLTRALVLMRLPAGYVVPDSYTFTNVFKRLRANPGKLITASDF